jgi:quinol monooxygenase YgiN
MTQAINYTVEFSIKPGQQDGFAAVSKECTEAVNANEPGMNAYQWYYNDDKSKCYVTEWHANSDSIMVHLQNVGEIPPKLFEFSEISRFEVFGNPGDTAREALAGLGARFFSYDHGFIR